MAHEAPLLDNTIKEVLVEIQYRILGEGPDSLMCSYCQTCGETIPFPPHGDFSTMVTKAEADHVRSPSHVQNKLLVRLAE